MLIAKFFSRIIILTSQGDIHLSGMNDILFMILGKPEHPGHVSGTGQRASLFNYFHTSCRHHQGITNDEVARLVEVRLQEEKKFHEDEWKR